MFKINLIALESANKPRLNNDKATNSTSIHPNNKPEENPNQILATNQHSGNNNDHQKNVVSIINTNTNINKNVTNVPSHHSHNNEISLTHSNNANNQSNSIKIPDKSHKPVTSSIITALQTPSKPDIIPSPKKPEPETKPIPIVAKPELHSKKPKNKPTLKPETPTSNSISISSLSSTPKPETNSTQKPNIFVLPSKPITPTTSSATTPFSAAQPGLCSLCTELKNAIQTLFTIIKKLESEFKISSVKKYVRQDQIIILTYWLNYINLIKTILYKINAVQKTVSGDSFCNSFQGFAEKNSKFSSSISSFVDQLVGILQKTIRQQNLNLSLIILT